jgi:hypothetical protein
VLENEFDTLAALARARRLSRKNDMSGALGVLENHLDRYGLGETRFPLRVVMDLAMLYRFFERYADELALLEQFQRVHAQDELRSRVGARVSKVTALMAGARTSSRIPVNVSVRRARRMTSVEKKLHERAHSAID